VPLVSDLIGPIANAKIFPWGMYIPLCNSKSVMIVAKTFDLNLRILVDETYDTSSSRHHYLFCLSIHIPRRPATAVSYRSAFKSRKLQSSVNDKAKEDTRNEKIVEIDFEFLIGACIIILFG